jgi:DNA (cytosine-5)-methyltransferase 1
MGHKFPYKWNLADGYPAKGIEYHGAKVFGTFICGGGSTMGYKLSGYDHLGGVEIDPKIAEVYKANHKPKHLFVEDIRRFVLRNDLPKELYSLDLLDGSPPCSSFSMAGNREKDWGKKKVFKEGQAEQVLDDLFFEYIKLAKKLQPKVVLAENVKGLIQGNAKAYVRQIVDSFRDAGYKVQLFLLNAASMGVPQKRERVFFICQRNDMNFKELKLSFNEKPILFGEVFCMGDFERPLSEHYKNFWDIRLNGDLDFSFSSKRMGKNKNAQFQYKYLYKDKIPNTITAGEQCVLFDEARHRSSTENKLCGSYPLDYNFLQVEPHYLIGMSVPPVMTAQIAHQIWLQWLSKQA